MATRREAFLTAVLGSSGALALSRLEAIPGAHDVVPPRAALAWLAGRLAFNGSLPGCPDVSLALQKSDGGFTGSIWSGQDGYAFVAAPAEHVAAAFCAFLGVIPGAGAIRDTDMARLGHTIDLLVKSQQKPAHSMAPQMTREARPHAPTRRSQPQKGGYAAPQAPEKHAAPTDVGPTRTAPKKKALLKIRLGESQTAKSCTTCGAKLFAGGKFKGCDCMAGLAKTVTTTPGPRGSVELTFGAGWDREAVLAILGDEDE
jgi:hypothetical protein